MLVLGRRVFEKIVVEAPNGDRIEIEVCATGTAQVRLGVHCPDSYRVARKELLEGGKMPAFDRRKALAKPAPMKAAG